MSYDAWSGPARTLARTVDAAVRAAIAEDAETFAEATGELRRVEPEVLAVLLGTLTQDLVERTHPDGLDSDDAEAVLARCGEAARWYRTYVDDHATVALLGALGLLDPEQAPRADPVSVTAHGLILIAALLPAPGQLPGLVESALRELHRAQTVEMP